MRERGRKRRSISPSIGKTNRGEDARAALANRLTARRPEIEAAALNRTYAIADPREAADPAYAEGLRSAVSAALGYGLEAVEPDKSRLQPPALLLGQARLAARSGVSLDIVLRRYFAGYTLLSDFLLEEAGSIGLRGESLQLLLRSVAGLFDRLLAAVAQEYVREVERLPGTLSQRRKKLVQELLDGDLVDAADLEYDFSQHHLGAVATGADAQEALRVLASVLDRRLLVVRCDETTTWAWLGGRRRVQPEDLQSAVESSRPPNVFLAIGECCKGLAGWRLSHRQALAAMPVALRGQAGFVRYADVALLASMLQDDLLMTSLHGIYLAPLEEQPDRGRAAQETLRAFFDCGRSVSSAAVKLGVSRQTVGKRLRTIEEKLGRSLASCALEIDAALRVRSASNGSEAIEGLSN